MPQRRMEDVIRALLNVVRAQHSASEGTEESPFGMSDVVDMAMNLVGRPESEEAEQDMVNTIQGLVESMAPDIFPPKTFEQMDDTERASSAASMIEASLLRPKNVVETSETPAQSSSYYNYNGYNNYDDYDDSASVMGFDAKQTANLNDAIYNDFMKMMGLSDPKVEYPFDRSQIRYGKEKTFTEQLADNEEENRKEQQRTRQLSAWELAQNAVDQDDVAHAKESYVHTMEESKTKSASQLAAEAIRKSEEEQKRVQLEAEKQALRMMEEAQKRGKDPMAFALHQQEILNYMEKNSGDLVSFEDYEDLTPEEKLELEMKLHIEKQLMNGVAPDQLNTDIPEEYIPVELRARMGAGRSTEVNETKTTVSDSVESPVLTPRAPEEVIPYVPVTSESVIPGVEIIEPNPASFMAKGRRPAANRGGKIPGAPSASQLAALAAQIEAERGPVESAPVKPANQGKPMSAAELAAQAMAARKNAEKVAAQNAKLSPGVDPRAELNAMIQQKMPQNTQATTRNTQMVSQNTQATPQNTPVMSQNTQTMPQEVTPRQKPAQRPAKPSATSIESQLEVAQSSTPVGMAGVNEAMLRQLSERVLAENASMIGSEGGMESLNDIIMANIQKMLMGGNPMEIGQEPVDDLIDQVIISNRENQLGKASTQAVMENVVAPAQESHTTGLSAVELAMAVQKQSAPQKEQEKKSAVELARQMQETVIKEKEVQAEAPKMQAPEEEDSPAVARLKASLLAAQMAKDDSVLTEDDFNIDLEDDFEAEEDDFGFDEPPVKEKMAAERPVKEMSAKEDLVKEAANKEPVTKENSAKKTLAKETATRETSAKETALKASVPEEEYIYVDPDELVLGEHTQAEIDEAMENLEALGLDGAVFERAKRMLLLEMAGSEAELDRWLFEQENGPKKKSSESHALYEEIDDLGDFDEDELEEELESAMDEDFDLEDESTGEKEATLSEERSGDVEAVSEEAETEKSVEKEAEEEVTSTAENTSVKEKSSDKEKVEKSQEAESKTEAVSQQAEQAEAIEKQADASTFAEKEPAQTQKDSAKKKVFDSREKAKEASVKEKKREKKEESYGVSVRKPFVFQNSASLMDSFEKYIVDTQENRKLSTGFKKLDAMLRYGLHKGSYFIDSEPQYLKNAFMQQIADRAAEAGVDVLYISTELSRYDLMVDTVARLSYEMNGKDATKAVSAMDIMTGEHGADINSLQEELNWYRGKISEHLYLIDQESVEDFLDSMEGAAPGMILEEMIRSIVKEGSHKPVVFIDNIENILVEAGTEEELRPLMAGIRNLAKELAIPIVMSYGYAQVESEEDLYPEEKAFHRSLGNMCDVYMELRYADMITEDSTELSDEDIREMMEEGETLLIDLILHRNRRPMKASCQIEGTPKFNYFEQ